MAHTSNGRIKIKFAGVATALALACAAMLSGSAWAQAEPTDVFRVNHYALANTSGAPNALMRIVNPTSGTLCAMTYVLDQKQVLNECCGCPVSHNGLVTLSVNKNLTSRPAKDRLLINGVIKVISSTQNGATAPTCDPATTFTPTPALREWITHPQINTSTSPPSFSLTEEEFADSPLIVDEQDLLESECAALRKGSTTKGVCICPQTAP